TIENGSPLMAKITGMGCTATAMVGACLGVEENTHLAAVTAMAIMGVAGDMANDKSAGPGSFQMNFYDSLYELSPEVLAVKVKTNA
ncbi:MAG TPA: hydroxyethylthiazole kinase, partial [Maribacter sp.]|nr:hydroxyethylthiazole kinase [Maribacter sp.]